MLRFSLLILFTLVSAIHAQESKHKDVPNIAVEEVNRRGDFVQQLGTIQSDETDLIADALAPPEDDSHKWYFTLVTQPNCPPCDRLKSDLNTSAELQSLVHPNNPKTSFMHYQLRRIDDVTQRDWFKNVEAQLQKGGYPCILIQPPSNGEYGKNTNTVTMIHGYNGDAKALVKKIRDSIGLYVVKAKREGVLVHHGENTIRKGFEQTAPFNIPTPSNPTPVQTWPPIKAELTLAEIQALVPTAPAEFLLQQVASKVTEPQQVLLAWQVYQGQNKSTPAPTTPGTPALPQDQPSNPLLALLGSWGWVIALAAVGWSYYREYRRKNQQPLLLDSPSLDLLLDQLKNRLQTK